MSLIVEDGTGLANAESYVSVADCDTYHTANNNATWTGTTAVKEAALRAATRYLDGNYRSRWIGSRQSQTQALEWPRYEAYDSQGFGFDAVPDDLVTACCELALRALSAALKSDEERGGAISSLTVGPISIGYASAAPPGTVYRSVDDILSRLLTFAHGGVRIVRV